MSIDKPTIGLLANYPVKFAGATPNVIVSPAPPAGVPVEGLPLSSFKEVVRRDGLREGAVEAVIDPPMAGYLNIALYMKGPRDTAPQLIERRPVPPAEQNDPVRFHVYQSLFNDGVHIFTYEVERASGNSGPSIESWALYHRDLPGGNDVPGTGDHPALAISLPAELGDPPRIGKEEADRGVAIKVSYPFMRDQDSITLELNRSRFPFTVQPGQQDRPFVITVTREMFEEAGNNARFPISYTVIDQVNNPTDKRRWSRVIEANVDTTSELDLKFINSPFTVAQGGTLKAIQLRLTRAGQPFAGIVRITLPAGTRYADGSSGGRDFPTLADGTLTIAGVKASSTPGTFSIIAASGPAHASSELSIKPFGALGPIALPGSVLGVTLSADGLQACVTGHQNVFAIDTTASSLQKVISIPTLSTSWEIALNKDATRAFACNGDNALSVIDLTTSSLITNIPVPGHPIAIVLSADGTQAFVSTWGAHTVVVVDTVNLRAVKTIPVAAYPRGVDISGDGSLVYVAHFGDASPGSVSVINVPTLSVLKNIPTNISTYGVAIVPGDNSFLICGSDANNQGFVMQYSTQTWTQIKAVRVTGSPRGIVSNHAGTKAYCCAAEIDTFHEIDLASWTVITRPMIGKGPMQIAVSDDDSRAFVTCAHDNTLWNISLQAGATGHVAQDNAASTTANTERQRIPGDAY